MRKKILFLFLALAGVVGLASCVEGEALTSIDFVGIADVEVENGSDFNFFDGVTAVGNDGTSFTELIVLTSTSAAVNVETGELDTLQAGVHAVRYEVEFEGIVARLFRYVTVKSPQVQEGELPVDMYQTGDAVVIRALVAGVSPDDLDIASRGRVDEGRVVLRKDRVDERLVAGRPQPRLEEHDARRGQK